MAAVTPVVRTPLMIWASLVVLTLLSAKGLTVLAPPPWLFPLMAMLAGTKALVLAWGYMGVARAPRASQVAFTLLLIVCGAVIAALNLITPHTP